MSAVLLSAGGICQAVSTRLSIPLKAAKYVLQQVDHGATVPFLARYRRDETGNLDEKQLRQVIDTATEAKEVQRRREFMMQSLEERRLLTPSLRDLLLRTTELPQLEDMWEPYKVRKASLASRGREAGLNAEGLLHASCAMPQLPQLLKGIKDGEKLLVALVVEDVSRNAAVRAEVLQYVEKTAALVASVLKTPRKNCAKALNEKEFSKLQKMFDHYDGKNWSAAKIRGHVLLALHRGEEKGAVHLTMCCGANINSIFAKACENQFQGVKQRQVFPQSFETQLLEKGLQAAREYLVQAAYKSVRRDLWRRAEEEAIGVFAANLRHLLLQRPLTQARLLAMDPGLTNGVKCVALSEEGELLQSFKCSVLEEEGMMRKVEEVVTELNLNKIVIGNGTASDRTSQVVARTIKMAGWQNVEFAVVSETGASVYSVSDAANEEFPDLDILYRGAVSIGRRVLDPLSELVKIPVKSMGIGMYQHDVNEKKLVKSLNETVESCVAAVGVNAEITNKYVMEKVPGIEKTLVHQIVLARHAKRLNNREDFRRVPSMTESTYAQIVGFFRFPNSSEPLDNTILLPEWYPYVRRLEEMTTSLSGSEQTLTSKVDTLQRWRAVGQYLASKNEEAFCKIVEQIGCGVECLRLIQKELQHPGMDPRSSLPHAGFMRTSIVEVADLVKGDIIKGIVQSVTTFGAFVDCGLHQNLLVRGVDLSNTFPGALLDNIVFDGVDNLGRPQVHLIHSVTPPPGHHHSGNPRKTSRDEHHSHVTRAVHHPPKKTLRVEIPQSSHRKHNTTGDELIEF